MIYYLRSRFLKSNWDNPDAYQQAMVAAGHFVLAAWAGWLIGIWAYLGLYLAKEAVDVWRTRGRAWADSGVDVAVSGMGLILATQLSFEAWAAVAGAMAVMAGYFILDYMRWRRAKGE